MRDVAPRMESRLRIGGVVFDAESGEVHHPGGLVRLEPQPAAVLALLAGRAGELVGHDELRRVIWGETTHVNFPQSLHYCIRRIRVALGDTERSGQTAGDRRQAAIIESVPRRGYRLRAPVEPLAGPDPRQPADQPRPPLMRLSWPLWAAAAAALMGVAIVERRPNDHHQVVVAVLQAVHDLVY